jgi:hypothetical protein
MAERIKCEICDREFKNIDSLEQHNRDKHSDKMKKEKNRENFELKKYKGWIIFILIIGVFGFGIYWLSSNVGGALTLPPTTMAGHIEASPKSHVLKKPMDIAVQKHMLEHVDGQEGARGGIIINYDCENYECDKGLVEKLEGFAGQYDYVYVAPFKNMQVKIALTKLGRIKKLDFYDEGKIETFITGIFQK